MPTNATNTTATYAKLRSGEWGVRVTGPRPSRGDRVTVTTRAGAVREAYVDSIVWEGGGVTLCTVVGDGQRGGSGRSSRAYRSSRSCPTGGNCSSVGNGRSCGAEDCDGY